MLKAKRETEFYKFNSPWRGRGQRLGVNNLCDLFFCDCYVSQEILEYVFFYTRLSNYSYCSGN